MAELVLKNHSVKLNGKVKQQIVGTAIGIKFSRYCVYIYMNEVETLFLKIQDLMLLVWFLYVNDIFLHGIIVRINVTLTYLGVGRNAPSPPWYILLYNFLVTHPNFIKYDGLKFISDQYSGFCFSELELVLSAVPALFHDQVLLLCMSAVATMYS